MMENRLPLDLERILLDAVANPLDRRYRYDALDFPEAAARDVFLEALRAAAPVRVDVCQEEPNEICVRADGVDADGFRWSDVAIILLEPDWSAAAGQSRDLADDIVTLWPRLVARARTSGDGVVGAVLAAGRTEAR